MLINYEKVTAKILRKQEAKVQENEEFKCVARRERKAAERRLRSVATRYANVPDETLEHIGNRKYNLARIPEGALLVCLLLLWVWALITVFNPEPLFEDLFWAIYADNCPIVIYDFIVLAISATFNVAILGLPLLLLWNLVREGPLLYIPDEWRALEARMLGYARNVPLPGNDEARMNERECDARQ